MAVDTYALVSLANFKTFAGIDDTDNDAKLEMIIDAVSDRIESYCGRKFLTRSYSETFSGHGDERLRLKHAPITAISRVCVGRVDAVKCTGTGTSIYEATVTVSSTALTMLLMAGAGNTTSTITLADYTTLTTLVAAATAETGWTVTLEHSDGNWASADLIATGALHCLSPDTAILQVWEDFCYDYEVDWEAGELIHGGDGWTRGSRNIYVEYTAGYTAVPDDVEQAACELVKDCYDLAGRDGTLVAETVGSHRWQALVRAQPLNDSIADKLAPHRRIWLA